MNLLKLPLLTTILFAVVACNSETKKTNHKEVEEDTYASKLDSLFTISYERDLLNGNVLIAKKGEVIYQNSFGFLNNLEEKKLNEKSIFNIGSISKEFNGVAIMMLVEKGQLSLDDPLSKFDLNLPEWAEKVTVRHIINYAGGIPGIDSKVPSNDNEAWSIIRSVDTLLFEPGSNFQYENSNVFLQHRVIEKASGLSFQEFVIQNIVKPLNMTNSFFDPEPSLANRTSCFDLESKACPEMEFISGWLWVDINDFSKWVTALNTNQLISKESFNTLLHNPYVEGKTSSLGEYFEEEQLQRHNGTSLKYESIFFNDFKNDVVIVIFSNQRNKVWNLGHEALNIMTDQAYSIPKKSVRQAIQRDVLENVDKGIMAYQKLKKQSISGIYNFENPTELNNLGYDLLRAKKVEEAIRFFAFAISEFPENANLYDSYAEAQLVNEQYDLALTNYEKSLALNPKNTNASIMIKKIKALNE